MVVAHDTNFADCTRIHPTPLSFILLRYCTVGYFTSFIELIVNQTMNKTCQLGDLTRLFDHTFVLQRHHTFVWWFSCRNVLPCFRRYERLKYHALAYLSTSPSIYAEIYVFHLMQNIWLEMSLSIFDSLPKAKGIYAIPLASYVFVCMCVRMCV